MRTLAVLLALTAAAVPATAQQTGPDCARIFADDAAQAAPDAAESGAAPIYELSAVDQLPRIANPYDFQAVLARGYPPPLRDAGVGGVVRVCFVVEADGRLSNSRITRSTDPRFDQPTLDAVGVIRFRPARLNGRPVRVWVEQPVQWVVSGISKSGSDRVWRNRDGIASRTSNSRSARLRRNREEEWGSTSREDRRRVWLVVDEVPGRYPGTEVRASFSEDPPGCYSGRPC